MKILFLLSQLPYPPDTGAKIRSLNLIKHLAKKHTITLMAFGNSKNESDKIHNLSALPLKIKVVQMEEKNPYLLAVNNLFSRYPYSVEKYYSKEMSKKIDELLDKENLDIIHCDSVQVSRNVLEINKIPRLLTEHNVESQILKRAAQEEKNLFKKIYFYLQYLKLKKYEAFACKQFDHIVTVSEDDKKFLTRFVAEEKISVVPNGVDTEYFRAQEHKSTRAQEENAIVFTGSMDWLPNADAVKYFCKDILPLIWKVKKELRFYIVGRNPSKEFIELANKDKRIVVTGSVIDVRPYMGKAAAFVVPLRIGGGTRLKILEAISMEKAVISTSIGCEGLEVTQGQNIMISDTADDFANTVIEILNNIKLRNKLAVSGRRLAEEKYDWKFISHQLDIAWSDAANKRPLPILLYHDIREDGLDLTKESVEKIPYILDESVFEKQMRYLHDNNYETIGLKDFYDKGDRTHHKRAVIISFDDGLISNYTKAMPILKKYGLKSVFFITAGMVGREGMMDWREIKELVSSGMEIGSHSLTHAIPTGLARNSLERELAESKRILEENLHIKIDYFSSPTGFYNPVLPELAKETGYKAALISRSSLNKTGEGFLLNKTSIKRGYNLERFMSILSGDKATFNKLLREQETRNKLKKLLGSSAYNRARKVVLEGAK